MDNRLRAIRLYLGAQFILHTSIMTYLELHVKTDLFYSILWISGLDKLVLGTLQKSLISNEQKTTASQY